MFGLAGLDRLPSQSRQRHNPHSSIEDREEPSFQRRERKQNTNNATKAALSHVVSQMNLQTQALTMSLEIFLQLFDYLGLTIENQENKFSDLTQVIEHLVYANNKRSQVQEQTCNQMNYNFQTLKNGLQGVRSGSRTTNPYMKNLGINNKKVTQPTQLQELQPDRIYVNPQPQPRNADNQMQSVHLQVMSPLLLQLLELRAQVIQTQQERNQLLQPLSTQAPPPPPKRQAFANLPNDANYRQHFSQIEEVRADPIIDQTYCMFDQHTVKSPVEIQQIQKGSQKRRERQPVQMVHAKAVPNFEIPEETLDVHYALETSNHQNQSALTAADSSKETGRSHQTAGRTSYSSLNGIHLKKQVLTTNRDTNAGTDETKSDSRKIRRKTQSHGANQPPVTNSTAESRKQASLASRKNESSLASLRSPSAKSRKQAEKSKVARKNSTREIINIDLETKENRSPKFQTIPVPDHEVVKPFANAETFAKNMQEKQIAKLNASVRQTRIDRKSSTVNKQVSKAKKVLPVPMVDLTNQLLNAANLAAFPYTGVLQSKSATSFTHKPIRKTLNPKSKPVSPLGLSEAVIIVKKAYKPILSGRENHTESEIWNKKVLSDTHTDEETRSLSVTIANVDLKSRTLEATLLEHSQSIESIHPEPEQLDQVPRPQPTFQNPVCLVSVPESQRSGEESAFYKLEEVKESGFSQPVEDTKLTVRDLNSTLFDEDVNRSIKNEADSTIFQILAGEQPILRQDDKSDQTATLTKGVMSARFPFQSPNFATGTKSKSTLNKKDTPTTTPPTVLLGHVNVINIAQEQQTNAKNVSLDKQNLHNLFFSKNTFSPDEIDETPSLVKIDQTAEMENIATSGFQEDSCLDKSLCTPKKADSVILRKTIPQRSNRPFLQLPSQALVLMADLLGERLPSFMFTNRITFKMTLHGQLTFYETQRQQIMHQSYQLLAQAERMQQQERFELTEANRVEFLSISDDDWNNLIAVAQRESAELRYEDDEMKYLSGKDVVILRLLFTFMCVELSPDNSAASLRGEQPVAACENKTFLSEVAKFMIECKQHHHDHSEVEESDCNGLREVFDPEVSFNVSESNKSRIKALLITLQQEKTLETATPRDDEDFTEIGQQKRSAKAVIEVFTNMLFEALQFVNLIPNMVLSELKQEADELLNVAEAFEGIKNNLIDFKNLVR